MVNHRLHKTIVGLLLLLSLYGCKETADPPIILNPVNHMDHLVNVAVTNMREDMMDYCAIDSMRHRFLFVDMTKQAIQALDTFNGEKTTLFKVSDLDSAFKGELQFIYVLPDGNYLLYEHYSDACDCLWKLWPETGKLKKVFTYRNKYQFLKWNWSITYDNDKSILYLSEYGKSSDNPYDYQTKKRIGYKGGSTIIWKTQDNGETWTIFKDFSTLRQIDYEQFHIHALFYDQYTKRLYVTSGDGQPNRNLWWVDEQGSWKYKNLMHYWGKTDDAYSDAQMISFYVGKDFLLAGGDDFSNCIYLLNKPDMPNDIQLQHSFFYNTTTTGKITQYTGRFKRLSNGMIITMLVNGDSNGFPRQTRIVGTFDGYTWQELYAAPMEYEGSKMYQMGIFDEWDGHVYFSLREWTGTTLKRKFIELEITNL